MATKKNAKKTKYRPKNATITPKTTHTPKHIITKRHSIIPKHNNMKKNKNKYQNKYRIESARAQWWDYGWNGALRFVLKIEGIFWEMWLVEKWIYRRWGYRRYFMA